MEDASRRVRSPPCANAATGAGHSACPAPPVGEQGARSAQAGQGGLGSLVISVRMRTDGFPELRVRAERVALADPTAFASWAPAPSRRSTGRGVPW